MSKKKKSSQRGKSKSRKRNRDRARNKRCVSENEPTILMLSATQLSEIAEALVHECRDIEDYYEIFVGLNDIADSLPSAHLITIIGTDNQTEARERGESAAAFGITMVAVNVATFNCIKETGKELFASVRLTA